MPGPIPKRSEQRRRTNATPGLERAVVSGGKVRQPPAMKDWHPLALSWYRSLAQSGQAQWYEPSDWQTARLLADQMSRMLYSDEPSAAMLSTILTATRDLLTTEGQRRRLRLELVREVEQAPTSDPVADDVDNIIAFSVARA